MLAFADDMTGALEVGAKFATAGATVTTRADADFRDGGAALIIDTETRHLEASAASERLNGMISQTRHWNAALIYKKTDSTLRGNIGSELSALAKAYPDRAVIFSPAYPEMGRTVRDGNVFVDGRLLHTTSFASDALNPVLSSYVPDAIGARGVPVMLHANADGALRPGAIHVFDAEVEDDVAAVTNYLAGSTPAPIFCGTGSLAGHLRRKLKAASSRTRSARPAVRSCLVVNGSRHPRSEEQVRYAQSLGWPAASPNEILENGMREDWTILRFPFEHYADPRAAAGATGSAVSEIVRRRLCSTLMIFGGDTAYAVLEALDQTVVFCLDELLPGIPFSTAGEVNIISKAGGFGPVDVLPRIRQRIREEW